VRRVMNRALARFRDRAGPTELAEFDFRVPAAIVFLFSAGGLMVLSLGVPGYLRSSWQPIYLGLTVLAFVLAFMTAWIGRMSGPGAGTIIIYSDLAIVIAAFSQADRSSGRLDAALLTLPTLFIAVFLPWGWTLVQSLAAGGCGLLILSLSGDRPVVIAVQSLVIATSAACPAVIVVILRTQLSHALQQARALATTDPLTGLLNRRGMDERSAAIVAQSQRARVPIGVLVADLDHFKKVNDRYGHTIGDHVLRLLATAAGASVRAEDLVVRLGGEEIAVVGVIDDVQLVMMAERLRAAVQTAGQTWTVTVSIGTAWRLPDREDDPTELLWSLIDAADNRMYEAKRAGRNQVVAQSAADRASG
jgi:diguanylate cyclase (GGDEF)-like protein